MLAGGGGVQYKQMLDYMVVYCMVLTAEIKANVTPGVTTLVIRDCLLAAGL